MKVHRLFLTVWIASVLLTSFAAGGTWPRFRGPNGQGISDATTIPIKWTDGDYAWKIDLPGEGPSSPVIWEDRVFITCADAKAPKGMLLGIEVGTGKVLWQNDYPLPKSPMNALNSYATGTPAATAECVYALFCTAAKTILVAVDHSGQEIFTREFGVTHSSHGPGVSPMVVDDMVVFTHEQRADLPGYWIALDAKTGKTRWTLERDHEQISYSTPCLFTAADGSRQLIFTNLPHGIAAVRPGDGVVLWEAKDAFNARVVSSPVLAGDVIVGSCGQGGGGQRISAVKPPASVVDKPQVVWTVGRTADTPYVPTGLYKDSLLYTCHDQGTVTCRRAADGNILWSEKPAGRFYASPIWIDGRLYTVTREGQCVVLKAGADYALLAVNDLGEASDATPAVADERMILRTTSKLMCLTARNP